MATTNLNLNTLAGTEKLKSFPTPYNDNMDAIDGAFGAGFGVGNNSSVNAELNGLGNGMAIIANGNTHAAITSGQYVYVRQHGSLSEGLYKATSNISANGTLSGSNLTAVSSGGLNDVYSSLNSKITWEDVNFTLGNGVASGSIRIRKMNKLVHIYGAVTLTGHTQWTDYLLADLSAQNIKSYADWVEAVGMASANGACVNIELRGDGKLYARILGATLADNNIRFNIVCSIA